MLEEQFARGERQRRVPQQCEVDAREEGGELRGAADAEDGDEFVRTAEEEREQLERRAAALVGRAGLGRRRRRLVLSGDDRLGVHDEAEGEVVGEEGGERRHAAEGGAAGLEARRGGGRGQTRGRRGRLCLRRVDQRHEEAEDLVQRTDAVGRAALRRLRLRRLRRRRNLGGRGRRRRRLRRRRRRRRGCRAAASGAAAATPRAPARRPRPSPSASASPAAGSAAAGAAAVSRSAATSAAAASAAAATASAAEGVRGGDGGGGGGDAADDGGLAECGELGDAREEAADDLAERRLRRVAEQLREARLR